MKIISNFRSLSSFLTLTLVSGVFMLTLNSCFSNPEEPVIPNPDDNSQVEEDPTPEEPDIVEPEVEIPAVFAEAPMAYVKISGNFESSVEIPEQIKEYTGFILSFNKDNHTPNYVSWELLASEASGTVNRNDFSYWVDKELEGCLDTDYAYNTYSYERGHMCPAADQKWSEQAMKDCMVMANMCPQLRSINAGIWETLENKEREWAKRDGAIWIVAGPIYDDENDNLYLGRSKARVPSSFFKAFLYEDEKNPRAIAFVFSNGTNPGNLAGYAMSVDDLEEITGFDLFPALPNEIEKVVESTFDFNAWDK